MIDRTEESVQIRQLVHPLFVGNTDPGQRDLPEHTLQEGQSQP